MVMNEGAEDMARCEEMIDAEVRAPTTRKRGGLRGLIRQWESKARARCRRRLCPAVLFQSFFLGDLRELVIVLE